jgi:RNA polymerase sigma factor (sigma-70 family)
VSDASLSPNTDDLCFWVTELQAGRPNAAEPTLRKVVAAVERFATRMLNRFPRVGRFVEADDVVQGSLVRLLAAFREVRPTSRRHFYALTNELIRRELLDLVKHFYGPRGAGTHAAAATVGEAAGDITPVAAAADLDRLTAFHEAVAGLPAEEREVVGLLYYHDWPPDDIANLLQVSARTVRRRREDALAKLRGLLVE